MTTITVEDVQDINVDTTFYGTKIDFKDIRGATTRLELSRADAEALKERLNGVLNKV